MLDRRAAIALPLIVIAACAPPSDPGAMLIVVLETADRRAPEPRDVDLLLAASTDVDLAVRRAAVRALGRLQRPELGESIAAALGDDDPVVRATAAWSLAQAVSDTDPAPVIAPLYMALARDPDPEVRATAAGSIGRLAYTDPAAISDAEAVLVRSTYARDITPRAADPETVGQRPREDADAITILGVTRGLDSLYRRHRDHAISESARARLADLAGAVARDDGDDGSIRALAAGALLRAGAAGAGQLETWLADPNPEVRRLAVGGVARTGSATSPLLRRAFADTSQQVRYAVLSGLRSRIDEPGICGLVRSSLQDHDPHVRLLAIDLLAGCAGSTELLESLALSPSADDWRPGAHALVALARVAPAVLSEPLGSAIHSTIWQFRMYAARAATEAVDLEALRTLADDEHPNVVESAIRGLRRHAGHAADTVFVSSLGSDDPQLLIRAANALEATPDPDAARAALHAALERLTAQARETSRDARHALLERIAELTPPQQAASLVPYLTDFDPVIAQLAAATIEAWTGEPQTPSPLPLPPQPFPTLAELDELEDATATVTMEDGTRFVLRLHPFDAPTNAMRFARLARAGALDGLTFHRVAPNFVIQGVSPGANEYAGYGPYTRDELTARPHRRGTVGVSTRGRDTGDGQIFVNLVDNYRLDHDYTIFGSVIEGMDAVDRIVEGAVIVSVRVESAAR